MGNQRKKIQHLVVDTSAFIKNAPLQDFGVNITTVPEVVNEIKNKRQLRRLTVLPYDLQIKSALPDNVKFVNEFSKKTGDFPSLSATDLVVIALTYQLEKELNGTSHLNVAPLNKPVVEPFKTVHENLTSVAGFYLPKNSSFTSNTNSFLQSDNFDKFEKDESDESDVFNDAEEELNNEGNSLSAINNDEILSKNLKNLILENKSDECNFIEDSIEDDNECIDLDDDDNCYESDDHDWITPSNINEVKNKIASELEDDFDGVSVACLTTDFAMQNVLKQIGLHVLSLDGKLIKELRTFILRCYGCFKTTSVMSKVFCPNCGNKTLKKVAVSLDADGTQHIHINFKKPLTARGKKYSLPRPRGGKHSNNPILCEDQPMPQQKPSRLSRTKNNPLNDDYIAGYSPFVMRDVTSKSAMLGIKPYIELKHQLRRNPNEKKKFKK